MHGHIPVSQCRSLSQPQTDCPRLFHKERAMSRAPLRWHMVAGHVSSEVRAVRAASTTCAIATAKARVTASAFTTMVGKVAYHFACASHHVSPHPFRIDEIMRLIAGSSARIVYICARRMIGPRHVTASCQAIRDSTRWPPCRPRSSGIRMAQAVPSLQTQNQEYGIYPLQTETIYDIRYTKYMNRQKRTWGAHRP